MTASATASHRSGLLADKGFVILDIGHAYTKIGMSGEPAPRFIISSNAKLKPNGKLINVMNKKLLRSRKRLTKVLTAFMKDIYLNYLLINTKDSRVIIVESLYSPIAFRNCLAEALFHQLNVMCVVFMPSHLLCTFTIARQTALVVDVGYKEALVLPVYNGIPIANAWHAVPFAAEEVQNTVKRSIVEKCEITGDPDDVRPASALQAGVVDAELEDIVLKTCFVRPQDNDTFPPDVQFPLYSENYLLLLSGVIRSHSADVMFDSEDTSIQKAVLDSVLKCSRDCRKELCENILVVGGGAMLPGFNYRLKQELHLLLEDASQKYHAQLKISSFKFHTPPGQINCTQWLGASIFGTLETAVMQRVVMRDTFAEVRRLPDWMSPDPAQREELHKPRKIATPTMTRHTFTPRTAKAPVH